MKNILFKLILPLFMFAFIISVAAYAIEIDVQTGLAEGSDANEGITDNLGTSFLSDGCFIQIIKIDGSVPHPPNRFGEPTGGDTLIGTAYVGDYFIFGPAGMFLAIVTADAGSNLVVRAWDNATIEFASFWGTSEVYAVASSPGVQYWDINGPSNIPAFSASIAFDNVPPLPPTGITATSDVSGDILLAWTPTTEAGSGTMIRWSLTTYPSNETLGNYLTDIPITSPVYSYRHSGLTNGATYYYSFFSHDSNLNYSDPATTDAISDDTLPPTWEAGFGPTGTGIPVSTNITITFSDAMNTSSVEAAFKISPSMTAPSFNWSSGDKTLTISHGVFTTSTWYTVTIEGAAEDDAGNPMGISLSWSFRTAAGIPPVVSDIKIDGWKTKPGDIISPHPRITGTIYDSDSTARGIVTVEIIANALSFKYSSPELSTIFTIDPVDDHYGNVDVRFPVKLPAGTYTITLRAYDSSENASEEATAGLIVAGGAGNIVGPVVNYPSEFASGKGTTFAYSLSSDTEITMVVRGIKGSVSYKAKYPAGNPGGSAGYNEVYWDGLSNFGEPLGSGVYLVYMFSGDELLHKFKILVRN